MSLICRSLFNEEYFFSFYDLIFFRLFILLLIFNAFQPSTSESSSVDKRQVIIMKKNTFQGVVSGSSYLKVSGSSSLKGYFSCSGSSSLKILGSSSLKISGSSSLKQYFPCSGSSSLKISGSSSLKPFGE